MYTYLGLTYNGCRGFLCDNRNRCLPYWDVCDGRQECSDGSDEANCCKRVVICVQ